MSIGQEEYLGSISLQGISARETVVAGNSPDTLSDDVLRRIGTGR